MPHANCYRPTDLPSLIAGEYPGSADRADALQKLCRYREAGVTAFIDLTEPGELSPYDDLISEVWNDAEKPAYHRMPIRDVSVPSDPAVMDAILALIDEEIARGGTVYVHCWGGIGRTGTVVGCHLVRRGRTGAEAVAEVGRLFAGTHKAKAFGKRSPETAEQAAYIEAWGQSKRQEASAR